MPTSCMAGCVPGGSLFALFMQCRKEGAAVGQIEGPPYHLDIHAVRALFPADRWDWTKPPYECDPAPASGRRLGTGGGC